MAEERTSIIGKAVNLKKAGMPTVATVVILAFSSPGFYEFFFNRTDDEAVAKAEVGYEILKERSNAQSREIDQLRDQVRELRLVMLGGPSYAMEGAPEGEIDELPSAEVVNVGEPADLMPPDELFNGSVGVQVQQQEQKVILPESLDHESLVDRIQEKVSSK